MWRNISAHSACSAVWEWSESDLFGQCRCVAGRSPLVSHPLSCALSWILLSRLISSESSFVFDSLKLYSSSPIPLIILVILLWTPSRLSMSFWLCVRHACTQYSKSGLTRLLYKAMMFLFDLFSYVRLLSPTNLFALLTHVAMWWLGLSDWLITTPRSFSSVECALFCAPIVYSCFGFAWPKCTHLHFPGLNCQAQPADGRWRRVWVASEEDVVFHSTSCAPWWWKKYQLPLFTLFRPGCPVFSFVDVDTYDSIPFSSCPHRLALVSWYLEFCNIMVTEHRLNCELSIEMWSNRGLRFK